MTETASENESSAPRAFLVDDHWVALAGLKDFLGEAGIEVTGAVATPDEVVAHCEQTPDDPEEVIILDLSIDGSGGDETLHRIREARPGARVLVVSMREALSTMRHLYGLGVDGYVTKTATPDETVDAVRKVAAGRRYYMNGVAERLLETPTGSAGVDPREVLSDQELVILQRLAEGHSADEVASNLGIKRKTVHNRTQVIRRKLGNVAHTDLGWIARKHGLLDLDL